MSRVPTVRKADLDRVLKALADAGQRVARIEVKPGGQVDIIPADLTSANVTSLNALDRRRAERAQRAAQRA